MRGLELLHGGNKTRQISGEGELPGLLRATSHPSKDDHKTITGYFSKRQFAQRSGLNIVQMKRGEG